ncbi:T9SS type A sorting domain-containing protein [Flavilitoribacter nigricans]|uniref:Uncharacterized protein n=1 Tax=Flavilitoribacter nigricans (strain ATCC 23147 / DSM 23189 / NBRC 102662 / NCIMB 1420 / SS-2) TaxID=1122177 RepID=A0A2D0NBA9_FLAN2|nr:T9SS type A sorting domain-containing protein [Flavilitoribacter nigricans]PHN05676.1 hypothetical protein CRP01_14435 [Flavilitoribacter nigricans DSM 23189 = NBRC 102662]
MKKINLLLLLGLLCGIQLQAQRYLSPVFAGVEVTSDITYGVNATVLSLLLGDTEARPEELKLDVYQPAGDDETSRPLVIILHTGNFLPPPLIGGCTGTRFDAAAVNLASRLASMGYVVASADYRLGWNPTDPSQAIRAYGIINAAYRGVQDSRTAIRYFKKTVAEDGNPYGIDSTKIVLWGIGTGGYISLASATLDDISDTYIPKFFFQTQAGAVPMVNEGINGNVDGTTTGIVNAQAAALLPFPEGDTLNYPNHVEYSSEFQLGVNMGGALGDTSWIDNTDIPFISYHVPTDPFAPCEIGIVNVPPPVNLPVVEVMGSCEVQPDFTEAGVNAAIDAGGPYNDQISEIARSRNGGIESLYLFPSDDPTEGGQWSYSFALEPYGVPGSNCDTNSIRANAYLDTIIAYYAPRAFAALSLPVATRDLIPASEVGLKIAPNPATSQVLIRTAAEFPISDMRLFDLNGKMVEHRTNINTNEIRMQRNNLPAGIYVVKLRVKDKIVAQKLVFN